MDGVEDSGEWGSQTIHHTIIQHWIEAGFYSPCAKNVKC